MGKSAKLRSNCTHFANSYKTTRHKFHVVDVKVMFLCILSTFSSIFKYLKEEFIFGKPQLAVYMFGLQNAEGSKMVLMLEKGELLLENPH